MVSQKVQELKSIAFVFTVFNGFCFTDKFQFKPQQFR